MVLYIKPLSSVMLPPNFKEKFQEGLPLNVLSVSDVMLQVNIIKFEYLLLKINEFIGESEDSQIGNDCKTYIEKRLAFLENAEEGGQKVEKPQRKPLQQSAPQGTG